MFLFFMKGVVEPYMAFCRRIQFKKPRIDVMKLAREQQYAMRFDGTRDPAGDDMEELEGQTGFVVDGFSQGLIPEP